MRSFDSLGSTPVWVCCTAWKGCATNECLMRDLAKMKIREFSKIFLRPASHEVGPFGTRKTQKTPAISPYFVWKLGYIWREYMGGTCLPAGR